MADLAGAGGTVIDVESIMIAPVRVNHGEVLAWLVDSASPATYGMGYIRT
jgi:hypothetical protein